MTTGGQNFSHGDWRFDVDEVSAGVYRVRETDRSRRSIEATRTDPDELLEQCKREASRMSTENTRRPIETKK